LNVDLTIQFNNNMNDKLSELHQELAKVLLERVKDPDAKSSDLNVARQFLKDNNIDAVPVVDSPLQKLLEELPFNEKPKQLVKN
jgi:citrate lyase synthetase